MKTDVVARYLESQGRWTRTRRHEMQEQCAFFLGTLALHDLPKADDLWIDASEHLKSTCSRHRYDAKERTIKQCVVANVFVRTQT